MNAKIDYNQFAVGDLVHTAKNLSKYMPHLISDKDAIVINYLHNSCQAGSDYEHNYCLYIKKYGNCQWYNESQLTLIKLGNWRRLT